MTAETIKPEIVKTDDEWQAQLGPDRYHVLREKGTEPAWTGTLLDVHDPGLFRCAGCGAELFRTDDKFESGLGLAELHPGRRRRRRRRARGPHLRDAPDRGHLCPLRRSPGPRLPRRPRPHRPALLHELPLPRVRAAGHAGRVLTGPQARPTRRAPGALRTGSLRPCRSASSPLRRVPPSFRGAAQAPASHVGRSPIPSRSVSGFHPGRSPYSAQVGSPILSGRTPSGLVGPRFRQVGR